MWRGAADGAWGTGTLRTLIAPPTMTMPPHMWHPPPAGFVKLMVGLDLRYKFSGTNMAEGERGYELQGPTAG